MVRIIARGTLNNFVRNRVPANQRRSVQGHLNAWYAEAAAAKWKNSADLKQHYSTASILSAERVVFNIKGNQYRLIVAINYIYQVLLIKWVGTRREYDGIDASRVEYERSRYADSTNPE